MLTHVNLLLRAPKEVARRCRRGQGLRSLALVSLAAIAAGGAVFGGVIGTYRGGSQIALAAIKVPLAILAALALSAPAYYALAAVLGRPWSMRTVLSLALTSAARASLLLLAFAPVLWLAYDLGVSYHSAALAAACAYAVAGLAACRLLLAGLGPGSGRLVTAGGFALVFFVLAGQTAWSLRPYLVRPRTEEVPIVRAPEGSFIEAVFVSSRSAAGVYHRDHAPLPGSGLRRDRPGDRRDTL